MSDLNAVVGNALALGSSCKAYSSYLTSYFTPIANPQDHDLSRSQTHPLTTLICQLPATRSTCSPFHVEVTHLIPSSPTALLNMYPTISGSQSSTPISHAELDALRRSRQPLKVWLTNGHPYVGTDLYGVRVPEADKDDLLTQYLEHSLGTGLPILIADSLNACMSNYPNDATDEMRTLTERMGRIFLQGRCNGSAVLRTSIPAYSATDPSKDTAVYK